MCDHVYKLLPFILLLDSDTLSNIAFYLLNLYIVSYYCTYFFLAIFSPIEIYGL